MIFVYYLLVSVVALVLLIIINSLPHNTAVDLSNLKAFADQNLNGSNDEICLCQSRKHCGKRRKGWLAVSSPFPTSF